MTTPPNPPVPQYGSTPGELTPIIQDYTWFAEVGGDNEVTPIAVTPEGSHVIIANTGPGNAYMCAGVLPGGPDSPGPVIDGTPAGIPIAPGAPLQFDTRHSVWLFGDTDGIAMVIYTVMAL